MVSRRMKGWQEGHVPAQATTLPMKRRKLPLFWLPSLQGQHEMQPSPHHAYDPNLEPLLQTPFTFSKPTKHLRSLSRCKPAIPATAGSPKTLFPEALPSP